MADDPTIVVELLRQQGETLANLTRSQARQTDELHALRVEQSGIAGRMEAMTSIPARVANLETKLAGHHETINHHAGLHNAHMELLSKLRTEADERRGWQSPVGKIVVGTVTALMVLILGAILALIGIRNARATDLRVDNAANAKCYAAPAKPRPRYLFT